MHSQPTNTLAVRGSICERGTARYGTRGTVRAVRYGARRFHYTLAVPIRGTRMRARRERTPFITETNYLINNLPLYEAASHTRPANTVPAESHFT
jgi:hypothetical protein